MDILFLLLGQGHVFNVEFFAAPKNGILNIKIPPAMWVMMKSYLKYEKMSYFEKIGRGFVERKAGCGKYEF